jgi:hypothetical protein
VRMQVAGKDEPADDWPSDQTLRVIATLVHMEVRDSAHVCSNASPRQYSGSSLPVATVPDTLACTDGRPAALAISAPPQLGAGTSTHTVPPNLPRFDQARSRSAPLPANHRVTASPLRGCVTRADGPLRNTVRARREQAFREQSDVGSNLEDLHSRLQRGAFIFTSARRSSGEHSRATRYLCSTAGSSTD